MEAPKNNQRTDPLPLSGLVAWGGRGGSRLVLSQEATKSVSRKSLSPSTSEAMRGCTARWVIERLIPRTQDPFGAAELGSAAHRVFELLYALPAEQRGIVTGMELVTSLQDDHSKGVCVPADPDDLDNWHEEVSRRVMGLWGIEDPKTIDVVGTEIQLASIEVGGVPFFGYIDRVHRASDGGVVVADYKAGKVHHPGRYGDPHGDQLRLYVAGLSERPDISPAPSGAEVLYTTHRERQVVDIGPKSMAKTIDQFKASWDVLTKNTSARQFPTKTSALCGWCPAVTVCPAAKAKGLVPRTPRCADGELLGIGASAGVGRSAVPPSSSTTGQSVPETKESTMSTPTQEGKSWEPTLPDGRLNTNSYAATAVFGVVELAVAELHRADQPISARSVQALSQTFAHIISTVHEEVRGPVTYQSGLHSRLRGALRTTIETMPIPFGADIDTWDRWVARATNRVRAIAKTAIAMWESDDETPTEQPWAVLAKAKLVVVDEEGS